MDDVLRLNRSRRGRGFSLLELIIGIFLFGILSASIGLLVRSGLDYLKRGETRAELQRVSLFALSQVCREISESSAEGIRLYQPGVEPPGLVYVSPRGVGGVGYHNDHLIWRQLVGVWFDSAQGHLRQSRENLPAFTTFVPDLSPLGLNKGVSYFQSLIAGERRVLARNVTDFDVSGDKILEFRLQVTVFEGATPSRLTTSTAVVPKH